MTERKSQGNDNGICQLRSRSLCAEEAKFRRSNTRIRNGDLSINISAAARATARCALSVIALRRCHVEHNGNGGVVWIRRIGSVRRNVRSFGCCHQRSSRRSRERVAAGCSRLSCRVVRHRVLRVRGQRGHCPEHTLEAHVKRRLAARQSQRQERDWPHLTCGFVCTQMQRNGETQVSYCMYCTLMLVRIAAYIERE